MSKKNPNIPLYAGEPTLDITSQFNLELGKDAMKMATKDGTVDRNRTATVNPSKIELLTDWEGHCDARLVELEAGPDNGDGEYDYYLGAYHAFRDAIDVLHTNWRDEPEDEGHSKLALVAGAAITVGVSYVVWKKRDVIVPKAKALKAKVFSAVTK